KSFPLDARMCIVFINKRKIYDKNTPKFFVQSTDLNVLGHDDKIQEILEKQNLHLGHTIIFSYLWKPQMGLQVVIPPPFLEPSLKFHYDKSTPYPAGKNLLGLKVDCITQDEFNKLTGKEAEIWRQTAKWEGMGIPGWPQNVARAYVGPIEI
ncbi:hypothetical protein GYMLUDRAFT_39791, partial [Collybiopsis luxurians FD-317 M1]